MRGAVWWVIATVLTFLAVSLAFLFLANLATNPPEVSLTPRPAVQGGALEVRLDDSELASLEAAPDQDLTAILENTGAELLSDVALVAEVSSENTTAPDDARVYREEVEALLPGAEREVVLSVDLSPRDSEPPPLYPQPPRKIVEVRATTGDGYSSVVTAVLASNGGTQEEPG